MNLYSLTLQQPTCITKAIIGNFSGNMKQQEIVVARGKVLEIMRLDENLKLASIHSQEIFGIIQNIASFKLTEGIKHDFILVTSDSGKIIVLKFDPQKLCFQKVHSEAFGKTGCRRIIPGQYIATDPCGRACMIAAPEKEKFVYILNSENNKLTISSPLEAHKSNTITFDVVGLDTNYQNSQFACIEAEFGDVGNPEAAIMNGQIQKKLTIYQLELGLNHVIKLSSDNVPESAHLLVAVPARDGPGGLLVFCEDFVIYRDSKNEEKKLVPFPRRVGGPTDRKIMIVNHSFHRSKDLFFYLIQTELGDLFKLSLHFTNKEVHSITMQYFDSVPVSSSLCILKKGFLFVPCEKGNHLLFKFKSVGQDEQDAIVTDSTMTYDDFKLFLPRRLRNLELVDEQQNLSVITDMKVDDLLNSGQSQIYALCAAGTRSSLRIMKHGLAVNEIAESPLPGKPTGIYTIQNVFDGQTKYILISFYNATLVLSIRDSQIVEIKDSGIELQQQTLYVSVLEDNSIIQILSNGIRHIKKDNRINQFLTEGKIIKAASNQKQLVLGLQGGEIIYFELDSLCQLYEVSKTQIDSEVACLDIGDIPEGRSKSKFLAVGLTNNTVRILSLDNESCLQKIAIQALPNAVAESVSLVEMTQYQNMDDEEKQLYLYVGMNNGILLRASVDNITGNLQDIRTRFLGSKPVKCFKTRANNTPALMALSSKPWMCYTFNNKYYQVPLSYDMIDYSAQFSTSDCAEGVVSVVQDTLRIISIDKYGEYMNQKTIPLKLSPRKLVINPEYKNLIIMESDQRVYGQKEKLELKEQLYGKYGEAGQIAKKVPESQIGTLMAPPGSWASQLRVYDPKRGQTTDLIPLEQNEAAVSILLISVKTHADTLLVVGTATQLQYTPKKSFQQCSLLTFVVSEGGDKLQFLHRTPLDDIPYSLSHWKGKILAGVGNNLRLYEMGKKQLLKKGEMKSLTNPITHITTMADRIYAGHQQESVHVYKYKPSEQTFYEIADDILPRWVSNIQLVDYHTVFIADKFENIAVCRIPEMTDQDIEENPQFYKSRWEQGYLNGAPFKMDNICNFYTGQVITSLQKSALISTGNEVVLHASTMGSIGAFYPFETKEDIDFFLHLEMHMRLEAQPLCGRDHIMFRSFYNPSKGVVDGDLCEFYNMLPGIKQRVLAEELDRNSQEVMKKLDEIRNKIL